MPLQTLFKNDCCEWVDVRTPDAADLQDLHSKYGIESLLLEDTTDPNHLPKYEETGNLKFFLMRENTGQERSALNSISDVSTKLAVFLTCDKVITVHRMQNPSIAAVQKAIGQPKNREISADRIALKLAHEVMSSYDAEHEKVLETMDALENEIFLRNGGSGNQIRRLYRLKRKTGLNSRILSQSGDWILQFKNLNLNESEITDLRDKHKAVISNFDHLSTQITNLISMFLAMSDQRANQVMKILAIYSMYFFPITFIAGIYGMNFDVMPELHGKYSYYITLGVMGLITVLTFIYVRRKRW